MRIATPVCGLVRNDMGFVTIRIKLGAESTFLLSLPRRDAMHPDVAIRSPLHFKLQFILFWPSVVVPEEKLNKIGHNCELFVIYQIVTVQGA